MTYDIDYVQGVAMKIESVLILIAIAVFLLLWFRRGETTKGRGVDDHRSEGYGPFPRRGQQYAAFDAPVVDTPQAKTNWGWGGCSACRR